MPADTKDMTGEGFWGGADAKKGNSSLNTGFPNRPPPALQPHLETLQILGSDQIAIHNT